MGNNDSSNNDGTNSGESKITATPKSNSSLVEAMRILVPAVSAVVVAYFGYLQMTQPKMLEISATQTALAASVAAASTGQAGTPQATGTEVPTAAATDPAVALATPATPVSTPEATATAIATTAGESARTPTEPPATNTPAPTSTTPAASSTIVPADASTVASPSSDMVLITTREGGDPVAVLPETLRFQGHPGIDLLSGEWVPFTNIMAIEAGQVRAGTVPLELTFTDGATQSGSVDKDASLIQAETAHGSVQMHMDQVTRIEFPNPVQTPAQAQPSPQEMVTLVSEEGESAHVLANSLRFQGKTTLNLRSGEYIPLTNIVTIDVGPVRVDNVPIELTFTDGSTQSATLVKDSDLLDGETLHGYYQRATHTVQQIQLPNEAQSAQPAPSADELVTLTTPEGDIAQVIAGTLRFQDGKSLGLTSGEFIPLSDIRTLVVGAVSGSSVPIELTFTDGSTQSASVIKDSDVFQGETLHGGYLKNVQSLKQVDFPTGE